LFIGMLTGWLPITYKVIITLMVLTIIILSRKRGSGSS
jgi:hypothetical protein